MVDAVNQSKPPPSICRLIQRPVMWRNIRVQLDFAVNKLFDPYADQNGVMSFKIFAHLGGASVAQTAEKNLSQGIYPVKC